MNEQQTPASDQPKWGDSLDLLSDERKQCLAQLLWARKREMAADEQPGQFVHYGRLNGLEVFWLAISSQAGENGDTNATEQTIRQAIADNKAWELEFPRLYLQRADLRDANLEGAFLISAQLQGTELRNARLKHANLRNARLEKAFLSDAQLEGANFSDAWLEGAFLDGALLKGADLRSARLDGADLRRAWLNGANLQSAWLRGADVQGTHLDGADLGDARLEGAFLNGAQLQLANLRRVRLGGADLRDALLEGADLRGVTLDEATKLTNAIVFEPVDKRPLLNRLLRSPRYGPAFGDIHWGSFDQVQLTQMVGWESIRRLSDERGVTWRRGSVEHQDTVRAYRQVSQRLRSQGYSDIADRMADRAHVRQRHLLFRQLLEDGLALPSSHLRNSLLRRHSWRPWRLPGDLARWLFSWFLALLAGYGYHPGRSVFWYLATIAGFTYLYMQATHGWVPFGLPAPSQLAPLPWYEALILSVSSFHGRGFFQPLESLGDPIAALAAIEAVIGLLIEISFIATFTQRFFGPK